MKLKSLRLLRLPGFKYQGFELTEEMIGKGINIIVGPNSSGKTSICCATRKLLWPQAVQIGRPTSIHSEWEQHSSTFTISIEGERHTISEQGKDLLALLPGDHLATCFSMTIDDLFDAEDPQFARKISEEIAGGYDIKAASDRIAPGGGGKTEISKWKEARELSLKYEAEQRWLFQREERLPLLDHEIKGARFAQQTAKNLQTAIDAKKLHEEILSRKKELSAFPEELAYLKENDWDQYVQLIEQQEIFSRDFEKLRIEYEALHIEVGSWLTITLPSEKEIEEEELRLDLLRDLTYQLQQKGSAKKKYAQKIEEHRRLLGIDPLEIEKISAVELEKLAYTWQELERQKLILAALEKQIELLATTDTPSRVDIEKKIKVHLDRAANTPLPWPIFLLITTSIILASAALWLVAPNYWQLLAFLPLLSALPFWFTVFEKASHRARLGLPDVDLEELVHQWGYTQLIENQQGRTKELAITLAVEKDKEKKLTALLEEQGKKVGIGRLSDHLFLFAAQVKELQNDWISWKELELDCTALSERIVEQQQHAITFASRFDESLPTFDVNLWRVTFYRIKERIEKISQLRTSKAKLQEKQQEVLFNSEKISALLTKTRCNNHPEKLQQLTALLPDYQQASQTVRDLMRDFEKMEKNQQLFEQELSSLEKQLYEQQEKAERLGELQEEYFHLKAEIQQMTKMAKGQQYIEQLAESSQAVQKVCREVVKKELTDLLLRQTQKIHRRDFQPDVLQKAAHWFQLFTRGTFVLEVPTNASRNIIFEAIETATGERKTLEELSRGTRMQLLLAVRLAFALKNESPDLLIPLFLDEVLASTDPERFDAVTSALSQLAASGRQIFYFTCNPEDAWRWQKWDREARLIDLRKIQKEQAFLLAPVTPTEGSFSPLSQPLEKELDVYAHEIEIPSLSQEQPPEMASIYYLVDSSEDLYRFLSWGIATCGNWQHSDPHQYKTLLPPETTLRMHHRFRFLHRFLSLRKQGMAKKITRECLEASGLSSIFVDRLWDLAQEVHGDAEMLMEVIEQKKDERTKGLRQKSVAQLKDHLFKEGYLILEKMLTDDEIRRELLPLAAEIKQVGALEENKIKSYLDRLLYDTSIKKESSC